MTAGLVLGLMLAQSTPAQAPPADDLARIRKALEEAPPVLFGPSPVDRDGLVFRVKVEAFDIRPAWEEQSSVPPYVRTWFRLYHHEHLEQVTPIEFRGATLNPYWLPVDRIAGALVKQVKASRRASQERRARKEVSEALARLLACRSDSSRPGC